MLLMQRHAASADIEAPENSIWVGDSLVTLIHKGGKYYLAVRAPRSIPIYRAEIVTNHEERAAQVFQGKPVTPMIVHNRNNADRKPHGE